MKDSKFYKLGLVSSVIHTCLCNKGKVRKTGRLLVTKISFLTQNVVHVYFAVTLSSAL